MHKSDTESLAPSLELLANNLTHKQTSELSDFMVLGDVGWCLLSHSPFHWSVTAHKEGPPGAEDRQDQADTQLSLHLLSQTQRGTGHF